VGVFVDLDGGEGGDGGSVRFFVNGSEYGPGYKSGVKGPVVLGVELFGPKVVTLLPNAQKHCIAVHQNDGIAMVNIYVVL